MRKLPRRASAATRTTPRRRLALGVETCERRLLLTANAFLQGVVFNDLGGDGRLDGSDPRLPGAKVELFLGTTKVGEATTGADGSYLFDDAHNLLTGQTLQGGLTYTLLETPPTGFAASSAQAVSQVNPTQVFAGQPNRIDVTAIDPSTLIFNFDSGSIPPVGQQNNISYSMTVNGVTTFYNDSIPIALPGHLSLSSSAPVSSPAPLTAPFVTYCLDPRPDIATYPVTTHQTTAIPGDGGAIAYLYNHYSAALSNTAALPAGAQSLPHKDVDSGLQIAIWQLEFGSNFNVTGYSPSYTSAADFAAILQARDAFLQDALGKSEQAIVLDPGVASRQPVLGMGSMNFGNTQSVAAPTINTVAGGKVVLGSGAKLTDTATLSGGVNPTGTVTFYLFAPGVTPSAGYTNAVYSDAVPVAGNGVYTTAVGTNPGGYTPTAVGTYQWVAVYGGDAGNTPATDNGQNENQAAGPATPAVATVAAETAGGVVGAAVLTDKATVSGAYTGTGTITFTLKQPDGATVTVGSVAVTGNGVYNSPPVTATQVGTYTWHASYSGDANNLTADDDGANESVTTVKAGPAVATVAAETAAGVVGAAVLTDKATVSGAYTGTGTITFTLKQPDGATVTVGSVAVTGNGVYNSPPVTATQVGTYTWHAAYSGDGLNSPADDDGANESVTTVKAGPAVTTVAAETAGGVVGAAVLTDKATVSGAYTGTGTITFTLKQPDGATVTVGSVAVTGNGVYNSPPVTATQVGTYTWHAAYSGDGLNSPADDDGANESVATVKAGPAIATVAAETAGGVVGAAVLTDKATVSGAYTGTGTITFTLKQPDGATVTVGSVAVTGNGVYNSPPVTATQVGTYTWHASYSGDANNLTADDDGANESVTTVKAGPAVATVAAETAAGVVGAAVLTDKATVSGAYTGTGTITFTLKQPDGATVTVGSVAVTGNGVYNSPPVTATQVGTYTWHAAYSGDGLNSPADDDGANESVTTVKAGPAVTTVAAETAGGVVGAAVLTDKATVSGAYTGTGTITFTLKQPDGATVTVGSVAVTGNGVYNSPPVTATQVGTYTWHAAYSGDGLNSPADDDGANESVATVKAGPAIATVAAETAGGVVGAAVLTDKATVSGAYTGTGTITFTLKQPDGATVTVGSVAVTGNGVYNSPPVTATQVGTYTWHASYSGDANNLTADDDGANESVTTVKAGPAVATVAAETAAGVVGAAVLTDKATVSGAYTGTGTITFTLKQPDGATVTVGSVAVTGNGVYNSPPVTATQVGTYTWHAAYSGDGLNSPADDDGANESVTTVKAGPAVTTVAAETAGGVVGAAVLTDKATVSGAYTGTGTITFTLKQPDGATVTVGSVAVTGNGVYNSPPVTATQVGTYTWHASYSGDANNLTADDDGANESVTTVKAGPAVATVAAETAAGVVGAAVLTDKATVSGAYTGTGTITFTLKQPDGATVTVGSVAVTGNGVYNSPPVTATQVGTYTWHAAYSGDGLNSPADDDGTNESVVTVKATPGLLIEKTTNGPTNSNATAPTYHNEDTPSGPGVPVLTPGSVVTWTYKVTNTGNTAIASTDVSIVDDNGTPGNAADDLTTANGKVTFLSVQVGSSSSVMQPGDVWLYKATGIVQNLTAPGASAAFDLSGNSALNGSPGNIRTFATGPISVKASAFSRDKSTGAWATAYLGSYGGGLGVTDGSEDGTNNTHTVDNIGRDNYVLFEFSQQVIVDSAFLGYVVGDSDLKAWIGTSADVFNNHKTLSDAFLTGLGYSEVNTTTLATTRTADLNAGGLSGNVLVIAADPGDPAPNDQFKIQTVTVQTPGPGVYENKATVAAPGVPSGSDLSHYKNPAPPPKAGISGTKFLDKTGNGFSADDTGLGGVTIQLKNAAGQVVATTPTASNGSYGFTNLAAGTYYVSEAVPGGYVQTGPTTLTPNVSVSGGTAVYTVTLGSQDVTGQNFDDFQTDACAATGITYTINGGAPVTDLRGKTHQGDTVTVTFTIPAGATDQVSLVTYTAPGAAFDANTASQQQIYQVATGTFAGGSGAAKTYTLTVTIPECYYQIDFVCGPPIDHFGPASSNIFYTPQGRLFSADNGGTQACNAGTPVAAGQFATIGFWHNANGQAVINSLNGSSSSKLLGNWLAAGFPTLFGSPNLFTSAGLKAVNATSFAGLTNAQIASVYQTLWTPSGSNKNTYVQAFAVALGMYSTTSNLGGASLVANGLAAKYGFKVTATGGAGATFSTTGNTAAFPALGATPTVLQILQAVNAAFTPSTGVFYGGDATKTGAANTVLNGINTTGDIALITDGAGAASGYTGLVGAGYYVHRGQLQAYVDDTAGDVTPDEQARIGDALASFNLQLAKYGVSIVLVGADQASSADITVGFADTTPIGGVAQGVLGVTEMGGSVTLVNGWDWYTGSDPAAIGAGQYDFQTIVSHELGHALGLGHSPDPASVMYASLGTGAVRRVLTTQDLDILDADNGGSPEGLHADPGPARTAAAPAAPTPVTWVGPAEQGPAAAVVLKTVRRDGGRPVAVASHAPAGPVGLFTAPRKRNPWVAQGLIGDPS